MFNFAGPTLSLEPIRGRTPVVEPSLQAMLCSTGEAKVQDYSFRLRAQSKLPVGSSPSPLTYPLPVATFTVTELRVQGKLLGWDRALVKSGRETCL